MDSSFVHSTLPAPPKAPSIPDHAQWLSGEGAGSWFCIGLYAGFYKINRFSPEGKLECSGLFQPDKDGFTLQNQFSFLYLSHCQQVKIVQNNIIFSFERISGIPR